MMMILIAVALVVAWMLGFIVFKVAGVLIHLLLLAALVVGAVKLFGGSARSSDAGS